MAGGLPKLVRVVSAARSAGLCGAVCVAACFAAASPADAAVISDGELLSSSWNVTFAGSGAGGGVSSERLSTGGNPDSMRRVNFSVSAAPSGATQSIVFALHLRNGFVHTPATNGPITSVSMAEDTKLLIAASFPQQTGPLLRQDGVFYIARGGSTGSLLIWGPRAHGPFAAQDFVALDTSDPFDGVDDSVHPDFSASGSPIEVGFFRALSSGVGGGLKSSDCGLDNLVITVTTPPPPGCVGDLNGDGAVNTADLVVFLARFGTTVTPGGTGDLNGDGAVNTSDLTVFLGRFGSSC
jgi:hypothetical protein